jgi:hypothetical protein
MTYNSDNIPEETLKELKTHVNVFTTALCNSIELRPSTTYVAIATVLEQEATELRRIAIKLNSNLTVPDKRNNPLKEGAIGLIYKLLKWLRSN